MSGWEGGREGAYIQSLYLQLVAVQQVVDIQSSSHCWLVAAVALEHCAADNQNSSFHL